MTGSSHIQAGRPGSVEEFWGFVNERQAVYNRRSTGSPPPWTLDPILRTHRFCNVYRELDRGTRWAIDTFLSPDAPPHETLFRTVVYRLLNSVPTFEAVALPRHHHRSLSCFLDRLRKRSSEGLSVFGRAYATCTQRSGPAYAGVRLDTFCSYATQALKLSRQVEVELRSADGTQEAWQALHVFPGVGDFVAMEVVMDLIYTGTYPQLDEDSWVYVGPGAVAGLELLFGKLTQKQALVLTTQLRDDQTRFTDRWEGRPLTLTNVEAALCEYRKWKHLKQGRAGRRLFNP